MGFRAWVALALLAWGFSARAELKVSFKEPATFRLEKARFDLTRDDGIEAVGKKAKELLPRVSKEENSVSKRDFHALKAIAALSGAYLAEGKNETIRRDLIEIASALANNHKAEKFPFADPVTVPFRFVDALANPVCRGDKLAANVSEAGGDPEGSLYWTRPTNIAGADLRIGFGRKEIPKFQAKRWEYFGGKRTGRNPGCELVCDGVRIKVKFAETHSEPFTARIFDALGYNVDATDYVPRLEIKYDSRFFAEFNERPPMEMRAGLLFVPMFTFNFQKTYDPFRFIDHAVLTNGEVISGADLRTNFWNLESRLDYLVTTAANVQVDEAHVHSVGAWGFEGLGRENLRELRGAGILAGWLGWWDSRLDNTRLRFVKRGDGYELKHVFTDLGGGLGASLGTFDHSCERLEDFTPTFTRTIGKPSRFEVKYQPIQDTLAFKRMTIDDARWMARMIAQISREQIVDALEASGLSAGEVAGYAEKLWSRRNQLLRDLKITEVPELAAGAGNPK